MTIRVTFAAAGLAAAAIGAMALSIPARAEQPAPGDPPADAKSAELDATYRSIKKRFGFVPSFIRAFPEVGMAAAWDELVALEMNPNTALAPKTKSLVGIAVSAQIPCRYCIYFDTQAAKMAGATENEIKEAIAMAAITRHWSTVLNGMQIDADTFRQEMVQVFAYVANPPQQAEPPVVITDAASAYTDIEQTLGSVPTFLRAFPEVAIAAAWREMKMVQLSAITAIAPKQKELIGLAVAAQIPCDYCIQFHTTAAKLHGATDAEIKEAVAISAVTRHWSTILNGAMLDEPTFRREVDQMMRENRKANVRAAK